MGSLASAVGDDGAAPRGRAPRTAAPAAGQASESELARQVSELTWITMAPSADGPPGGVSSSSLTTVPRCAPASSALALLAAAQRARPKKLRRGAGASSGLCCPLRICCPLLRVRAPAAFVTREATTTSAVTRSRRPMPPPSTIVRSRTTDFLHSQPSRPALARPAPHRRRRILSPGLHSASQPSMPANRYSMPPSLPGTNMPPCSSAARRTSASQPSPWNSSPTLLPDVSADSTAAGLRPEAKAL